MTEKPDAWCTKTEPVRGVYGASAKLVSARVVNTEKKNARAGVTHGRRRKGDTRARGTLRNGGTHKRAGEKTEEGWERNQKDTWAGGMTEQEKHWSKTSCLSRAAPKLSALRASEAKMAVPSQAGEKKPPEQDRGRRKRRYGCAQWRRPCQRKWVGAASSDPSALCHPSPHWGDWVQRVTWGLGKGEERCLEGSCGVSF